jgi:hypothetical protein
MRTKPPPHPEPVKAGLEKVGIYGTRWGFKAGALGVVLLWAAHTGVPAPLPSLPLTDAATPQQWTAGVDVAPHMLAAAMVGKLPAPDPRQRKPPCDPDLEREFDGWCWLALKVTPPCPKGKAWEKDGACFAPSLNAARIPSTGQIQPGSVAGGAE